MKHSKPVRGALWTPTGALGSDRRPMVRAAAGAVLGLSVGWALALGGCSREEPGRSYFPLEAGHEWTYRERTEMESGTVDTRTLTMRTMGEDALSGVLDGTAWRRRSDDGLDYWLRSDDTGVYRVASKTDVQDQPQADPERRYVLKAPLQIGTQWTAESTAYLLRRNNEFPPEIRHSHPRIRMTYTLDALQQRVRTAAGDFDGCLRVTGQGTVRLFADPVVGWKDMPLTTTEWYCPGAGLVRLERREPAQSAFLTGGTLTLELTSWQ